MIRIQTQAGDRASRSGRSLQRGERHPECNVAAPGSTKLHGCTCFVFLLLVFFATRQLAHSHYWTGQRLGISWASYAITPVVVVIITTRSQSAQFRRWPYRADCTGCLRTELGSTGPGYYQGAGDYPGISQGAVVFLR